MISMAGFEDPELKKLKEQERLAAEAQAQAPAAAEPGLLQAPVKPMTPFEQLRDAHGTGGAIMRIIGTGLSGGLLGDVLTPETSASGQAQYASDLELYNKYKEMSLLDPQDQALAAFYRNRGQPGDEERALQIEAGSIKEVDLNRKVVGTGQDLVSGSGNGVIFAGRERDDRTSQERNLTARNELYAREPADKNSPEWAAWDQERKFFESSVRANQVVNGTVYSGSGSGTVGDQASYVENTEQQAGAAERGQQDVQTAATMFADAKAGASEAYTAIEEYDFSLQNANEVLAGLESGQYQTGMARSLMLDYLGLGGIDDGTLLSMGTDEAIKKVQGFNGHTTDFEYGQAFNAAFARLKNNKDVNIGVMRDVIAGLENARTNAERAYESNVYDASNAARSTVETRWVQRVNKRNQTKYPKAPDIGFERDGLRYMGGDPTNLLNWVETD